MIRKENRPQLPATHLGAKPGDYPLGSIQSRAAARALLDQKLTEEQQKRFRLVVAHIGTPFELDNATCTCSLWPDGTVFESLEFKGSGDNLSESQREQLERLIRTVPIDGKTYRLVCSKNLVEITDR